MKKERFSKKSTKGNETTNKYLVIQAATLAVLTLTLATTTGCGKEADKETTQESASSAVAVETTPSIPVVPESVVENVEDVKTSETNTPTTVLESESNLVEEIDCNKYQGFSDWLQDADYTEPKLTVWNKSSAFLLSNGATFEGDGAICLYTPGGISNIKEVTSNVYIEKLDEWYYITPVYLDLNEETKITCDITYNDGTQDSITVYFTWRLQQE